MRTIPSIRLRLPRGAKVRGAYGPGRYVDRASHPDRISFVVSRNRDTISGWMNDLRDYFGRPMSIEETSPWMLDAGDGHLLALDWQSVVGVISIKKILSTTSGPSAV